MSRHEKKHCLKRIFKHRSTAFYVLGATLILTALCGTVFAYMIKTTEDKTNRFTPAAVSCEVQEITNPQVTEKSSIKVKNTGNINAYIRVRFTSYWVRTSDDGKTEIAAMTSEMPELDLRPGWLKGESDTYYYQFPIAPDALTDELLNSKIPLLEKDGCRQVIEVFAEAIQSNPAGTVSECWKVLQDENGKIVDISK